MQSYKIDIIIFEVCRYYFLHIIKKGLCTWDSVEELLQLNCK